MAEILKTSQIGNWEYTNIIGLLENPKGEQISLSWEEDIIFELLNKNFGRPVSKFQIAKELWNKSEEFRPSKPMSATRQRVYSLRKKIEGQGLYISRWRLGYKLTATPVY